MRQFTASHVGLIDAAPDGVYVLHAAPAGPGDGGVGDRVGRIPLSVFLSERGYVAARVLRLADGWPTAGRWRGRRRRTPRIAPGGAYGSITPTT